MAGNGECIRFSVTPSRLLNCPPDIAHQVSLVASINHVIVHLESVPNVPHRELCHWRLIRFIDFRLECWCIGKRRGLRDENLDWSTNINRLWPLRRMFQRQFRTRGSNDMDSYHARHSSQLVREKMFKSFNTIQYFDLVHQFFVSPSYLDVV